MVDLTGNALLLCIWTAAICLIFVIIGAPVEWWMNRKRRNVFD